MCSARYRDWSTCDPVSPGVVVSGAHDHQGPMLDPVEHARGVVTLAGDDVLQVLLE